MRARLGEDDGDCDCDDDRYHGHSAMEVIMVGKEGIYIFLLT